MQASLINEGKLKIKLICLFIVSSWFRSKKYYTINILRLDINKFISFYFKYCCRLGIFTIYFIN